ncbi:MAG: Dihydrolipoyllysine-residue succinyltransferase component of 2-oxoglutarate dehydrogenase complex [Chlamydiae bacterium]|nr:Dihydrolipoyllysine-residue succinyltransferase component of 2-oxoglutarate dehydrogenase complex [Chlamydiota bacterium]
MKVEITVPSMGESITEAIIGEIIKPSGSQVTIDEEILELETDKVNQVLYAPQSGVLVLSVNTDDVVKIGQVLGHIDTEAAAEAPPPKKAHEPPPKPVEKPAPEPVSTESVRSGIKDFIQEIEEKPTPVVVKKAAVVPTGGVSRKRMSKIRQVIGSRLVEAQQTTAMLTTFNEVDMTSVMALREEYKESFQKKYGVKLGFMSFFVKAAVSALEAVPGLNSYLEGNELVTRHFCDVGIAVGTERGLIVPVLRGCENLTFAEIEQMIGDFAVKARDGTISVDDLRGGGFTITNGGIYGSLLSTPILNPPQSGILGMHKIEKRPVVVNDSIVIRPMMYLAVSYDHRIVDGKEAVTFLVHIKNCLEDPTRLLLEV